MMKPVVLVLLAHYLPGFRMGGPLQSIANLVRRLDADFEFRILTSDRDLGDDRSYDGIETDRWIPVGAATVRYVAPSGLSFTGLARLIRDTPHDLVYLNSFFTPRFTIRPLLARRLQAYQHRPAVIAPRGEFSPGALALKQSKKRAWMALGSAAGLYSDLTWQASSEREAADIRAALGRRAGRIHVAANLSAPLRPEPPPHTPRAPGAPLRVVFLSRISPKKNLDYALRVLAEVKAPVAFAIYGPQEDSAYAAVCRAQAAALPAHIQVAWHDAVAPAEVVETLARHDLFFLPTRGENFGHVIAEAMGAGTPVLISDATPWRGLAERGVGHDLPLADPRAFAALIDAAASLSPEAALAERGRVASHARWLQREDGNVEANRALFFQVLGMA